MHHSLALALTIPMNLRYIHLAQYHETIVSLLFAGGFCYASGNYKFTLDVSKTWDMIQYKVIVVAQLLIILYTRVYLWFPTCVSMFVYFKSEGDFLFAYGGAFVAFIFSLFNVVMVVDAIKAAVKWLPKKLPSSHSTKKYEAPTAVEHECKMERKRRTATGAQMFRNSLTKRDATRMVN
eukprot:Sro1184_g250110.2  (179) ;mRNA; r:11684-12220